jgi:glutathione S-transferase
MMKVLGHDGSPFVRKVRIVLEEKRIPYEYVHARPSAEGSPVPELNPLAKIPVLVNDDGKAIYDSPVIVDYLDALVPEPRLIPTELEARVDVKRWEALGDGITDATVLVSHDYDKVQTADWHARQRLKITRGLAAVSRELGEREFCYGNRFSLADIAAGYALGYLDRMLPDIDWRKAHPNLAAFSERLAKRDSFSKTFPKA